MGCLAPSCRRFVGWKDSPCLDDHLTNGVHGLADFLDMTYPRYHLVRRVWGHTSTVVMCPVMYKSPKDPCLCGPA